VQLSDQAFVDPGERVILAVVGRSHARLAWDWYAKFFKLRDRDAHTEEYMGKSFRIETRPRQRISIDGEVLAKTPVTVKIAPGAIEVAAPA
jgi:diacylglycerol kinase family enzyme